MDIKVYKIDDCDYVMSKLSKEETKNWYEKEFDTEVVLEDIQECDLDNEKMLWETTGREDIIVSFQEVIKLVSEYRAFIEPFVIASTEY